MSSSQLKIAVGIATAGRYDIVRQSIDFLKNQTRLPDLLVVCPLPSDRIDSEAFADFPAQTIVTSGPVGLCAQRNVILSQASSADLIVFFDDDYLADPNYLKSLEEIFVTGPDICAATGVLLADDATGPGLTVEKGLAILNANTFVGRGELEKVFGLYGCNMTFRMKCIRENNLRFDENLPLYAWQEDVDFSLQIAPFGRLIKSDKLLGVHLGAKSGKTSGVRLGYSQIANPVYLSRKGTMSWRHARKLMSRNIGANLVRSLYPEPWIDRVGRLKGNVIALVDVLRGRASPMKILQLD
jgi:GT2 family glycosyltransferase